MEIQQGDHERNHASPKLVEPVRRWLDGGNLAVLVKKLRTEQNKFVWFKAASAIMTTDTRPKVAYEECKIGSKLVKISGIAKGSGMIAPNMATMLSFIFTDAAIPSVFLKSILKKVMGTTFNSITVDSDTSTNDMVGILQPVKPRIQKYIMS